MQVKAHRGLVLGIDDQREDRRLRAQRPRHRIDQQRAAKSLLLKGLIDRQAADEAGREGGVARQPPNMLGRQLEQRQAGRRQRVIASQLARGINRNKAIADPAADVLRCQFPDVAVERG